MQADNSRQEVQPVASKPDIVSLMWVTDLMNQQVESAEKALVNYSRDPARKEPLLQCLWAVHQITSTLKTLGMKKGEMLSLEMERALNCLYRDQLPDERARLAMGGLMQAIKLLPAYLAHTQTARQDTGQGLEQYVNDLRRWTGQRPRPAALFFYMDHPADCGITPGASPASDQEITERASAMLVLFLEMAKRGLRRTDVVESMKTAARIARKMQALFAGTEAERFWFTLIGLCEGIAGGLIEPDECLAQIFKAGAFMIKHAREHGAALDPAVDYADYQQQMLYYVAACKARPVHIGNIRDAFGIDEHTLEGASRGLVHMDAIVTAMGGALHQLDSLVAYFSSNDLAEAAVSPGAEQDGFAQETLEAARYRLDAASLFDQSDALEAISAELEKLYSGAYRDTRPKREQAVDKVIRGIMDVKLDVEHKLRHGLNNECPSRELEMRESVVTATFNQMSLVENQLQHILRRKALAAALGRKPNDDESLYRLTRALHRYLNKSDSGHEELRQAVRDAEGGDPDLDHLYGLAREFLNKQEDVPDRKAIEDSLVVLEQISGALEFTGMTRESRVIDDCRLWLEAASKAGDVREDDAFACFADAFVQLELHMQRSVMDPLDDTSHLLALAEQRAGALEEFIPALSVGADVAAPAASGEEDYVEDAEVPEVIRAVFIEESDEIIQELNRLTEEWAMEPQVNGVLRDIRRHFHTFKGNGRAVGANVLGELGWAAQDMLDHVLDGDLEPGPILQELVADVVRALPDLLASYQGEGGLDVARTRELTNRCFSLANGGDASPMAAMPASPVRLVTATAAAGPAAH
jgi:HPt (histidine-containing phosphotransfer) domain-containing protein